MPAQGHVDRRLTGELPDQMTLATAPVRVTPPARRVRLGSWGIRAIAAGVAAAALAATAAPLEQRWLLPIAVAAAVLVFRGGGVRSGLLLGYLFGAIYVLGLTFWLRAVGLDAWLLIGLVSAGFYALLGGAVALVRAIPGWPVWVACLWASVETVMAAWPLGGFPWTRLVWATAATPLAQWLPWIGASGVSFLAALTGSVLAWLALTARARPRAAAAVAVGMAAWVAVPSVVRPASLTPAWSEGAPTATVAVVQGGVPGRGDDVVAVHREVTANHVAATVALSEMVARGAVDRPDFVLWPENSTAVDPFRDPVARSGIEAAVEAVDAPVLVGAIVDGAETDDVLNQGIVWTPDGGTDERYTKHHPVPFGEYIPFRKWLIGLQIGRLDMIPRDMVPGTRTTPLDVAGVAVADLICFDIAFDDSVIAQVEKGAQLIAVQTSNAMFINTSQPDQQFAITRLRAMETGRYLAVASVNGVSAVIRPDGTVQTAIAPRTSSSLVQQLPLLEEQTMAVRIGDALRNLTLAAAAGALFAGLWRRRSGGHRTRGKGQGPTDGLP